MLYKFPQKVICSILRNINVLLNEHQAVLARSGPLYATGVFLGPTESSMQTASRSHQPFCRAH